jgi:selenide, water dikinase
LTTGGGRPRLVLLGGGHSHLFVLEGLAGHQLPYVETTLVSLDRRHAYSGMVPGMIGGRYDAASLSFDLPAICRRAGARFIQAEATAIETASRRLVLGDGQTLAYDVLSIAVGSTVEGGDLPGVAEHARRVKPIGRALELVPALERLAAAGRIPAAVVVGGGAAGVEVALGLRARLRLLDQRDGKVTLVESADRLLGGRMPAAEPLARRALAVNGVDALLGIAVDRVGPDSIEIGATHLPADVVVWATGARATILLRSSGLANDRRGFVLVNDHLQSVSHPEVFAAGDAASLERFPDTPKAGVYAVREGPILWANLQAALSGRALPRQYRPQPRFLALLNTGDGRAILSYGRLALWSRTWMRLKDRIDIGFMRRFQRLQQP